MKVLVIGAAGKSGRAVVEAALSAGHDVTAFVHEAGEYRPANVTVIEGDATNVADMERAIAGQDAVIDAIGGKIPWKASGLEQTAAAAIISAMQKHHVRRFVVISMIGVGDSTANVPIYERLLLPTLLGGERTDKGAMELIVEASGLNWTIIRPPFLSNAPATGHIQVFDTNSSAKAHKITRSDLATFIVAQLPKDEYSHRAVTIGNY